MTTPSTPRKAGPLLGDDVQTAWPFSFKVFAEGDIAVTTANSAGVETPRVLGVDYTVALNPNQETSPGGTVTYPISGAALPTGSVLAIVGDVDYDQPLDLPSGGSFSPLAIENQFDRSTMQIQQLREEVGRAARLPVTSSADADSLVADIVLLADNIVDLNTVAGGIADVATVATNIADVGTVAGAATEITITATNIAAVVAVGSDLLEPVSEIDTVAGSIANVNTVAGIAANVTTVAGVAANVTTVAGIAADVATVATNVADVTNFSDVYQGAKAVDPTLRNDGSALQAGDLYFSTAESALRAYSGTTWVSGTAGTVNVAHFTGDGVTVTFVLASAPSSKNNTNVFFDGVYQEKSEYSLSGVTLTFNVAPPNGVSIEVVTVATLALGETDAALVSFVPAGGLASDNVQSALEELDTEKQAAMAAASQVEMETGTEAALRSMSPLRVMQAITKRGFTRSVPVALSGQVSVDQTGIPAWASEILVMFSGMSTSGNVSALVQIGSSAGMNTTSYISSSGFAGSTNGAVSSGNTNGFHTAQPTAAYLTTAVFSILKLLDTTISDVICTHAGMNTDGSTIHRFEGGGGTASTTGGILDRVRVSVPSGTFDAGLVTFAWR